MRKCSQLPNVYDALPFKNLPGVGQKAQKSQEKSSVVILTIALNC